MTQPAPLRAIASVRGITTGNHGVGHLPARNEQDPKQIEFEHQMALAHDPKAVVDAIREVYQLTPGRG
jgi:hypothetical protein